MGYLERRLEGPRQRLRLGMIGQADAEEYDIDLVGQDDGQDRRPSATFRVLLQLGQGYMIHLYVVGAMQPGSREWLHSFWTKDCAVAEVEREEHGAPRFVRCPRFVLPRLFGTFVLVDASGGERRFPLIEATLEVAIDDDVHGLEARWRLADDRELSWSVAARWCLREDGAWRALAAGERVTFADPVAPLE